MTSFILITHHTPLYDGVGATVCVRHLRPNSAANSIISLTAILTS